MSVSETTSPTTGSNGLILDSLEVQNFRAFRHLTIEKLGRVNLITGKNNVGKSSLLEALWLYAENASPFLIRQLLTAKRELKRESYPSTFNDSTLTNSPQLEESIASIRYLFNNRPNLWDIDSPIVISPLGSTNQALVISVVIVAQDDLAATDDKILLHLSRTILRDNAYVVPYIVVDKAGRQPKPVLLSYILGPSSGRSNGQVELSHMVKANGLADSDLSRLWDNFALTDYEDDVVLALQTMHKQIEKIAFIQSNGALELRTPFVRLSGEPNPYPLRSLGDGINRLFGIVLALVNSKSKILLIDEVENGLHYSVLRDVWRLIFQTARRLNVQVFATTHSWDCIEAFQQAAAEDEADGALIRLQNKNGDVIATVFDEADLAEVTRNGIEVR